MYNVFILCYFDRSINVNIMTLVLITCSLDIYSASDIFNLFKVHSTALIGTFQTPPPYMEIVLQDRDDATRLHKNSANDIGTL